MNIMTDWPILMYMQHVNISICILTQDNIQFHDRHLTSRSNSRGKAIKGLVGCLFGCMSWFDSVNYCSSLYKVPVKQQLTTDPFFTINKMLYYVLYTEMTILKFEIHPP